MADARSKKLLVLSIAVLLAACGAGDQTEVTEDTGSSEPESGSRGSTVYTGEEEPLNAIEWQYASDLLRDAANMVEERGFQQAATHDVYPVCVATALERAFYEGDYSLVDFNYAREALAELLGVPRDPAPDDSLALAVPYWGRHLMEWNDEPGRTQSEVVEFFDNASALALEWKDDALAEG